jgi:hypothetical protein
VALEDVIDLMPEKPAFEESERKPAIADSIDNRARTHHDIPGFAFTRDEMMEANTEYDLRLWLAILALDAFVSLVYFAVRGF